MNLESTERSTAELYEQVAALLSQKDWDAAFSYVRQLCDRHPDYGPAWELRGILEVQLEHPHVAIHCLERASLLTPLDPLSSRLLALQYIVVERRQLGIDLLVELANSCKSMPPLIRLISQDLVGHGCLGAATDVLNVGLERFPACAMLWHELSAVQSRQGISLETCLRSVSHAVALSPHVADFRISAAMLMIKLNLAEEAYHCVRLIPLDELRCVSCDCCVWRLIHIFDCFNDRDRLRRCYEQLRYLHRSEQERDFRNSTAAGMDCPPK
ncbi:MAG: tetratricopeptide repeat protein [Planctomycetota bacterium]